MAFPRCYFRILPTIVALLAIALTVGPTQGQIPWTSDYASAQQASQQTGAILLLHFYSNDCVPCKALDARAFQDPELINAMKQTVIPVKVNVDNTPEIAKQYKVTRWPTDVYLSADGTELVRSVSPQKTSDYLALLSRVAIRNRDHTLIAYSENNPVTPKIETRRDPAAPAFPTNTFSDTNGRSGSISDSSEPMFNSPNYFAQQPVQAPAQPRAQTQVGVQPQIAAQAPINQSAFTLPNPSPKIPSQPVAYQSTAVVENTYLTAGPIVPNNINQRPIDPIIAQQSMPVQPEFVQPEFVQPEFVQPELVQPELAVVNAPSPMQQAFAPTAPSFVAPPVKQDRVAAKKPTSQLTSQPKQPAITIPSPDINQPSMSGYCPVSLEERSAWIEGNRAFAVEHRGRFFYLANAAAQEKFLANPDRYSPMFSGYDLIQFCQTGQFVDGLREYGCWYKNRVYLFSSAESRAYFESRLSDFHNLAEQMYSDSKKAPSPKSNTNPNQLDPRQGRIATTPSESEVR
jgi:thiol-disulfide isomerase/thioredoxin